MNRDGDRYFCTDCNSFVKDINHRCEQWSNTIRIPREAISDILDDSFLRKEVNHYREKFYSMEATNAELEGKIEGLEKRLSEACGGIEVV